MNTENKKHEAISSHNFKSILQNEFLKRCKKNPAYSLRAFSKYLEIDQSNLSKIMKGQRAVSKSLATKIGLKVGLRPSVIENIYVSVEKQNSFFSLSDEQFAFISEWHHFAILELLKIKNVNCDPQNIALRLGIHVETVRAALHRLHVLNMIQPNKKGWKILATNQSWSNNQQTTEARKLLQKSWGEKSLWALENIPFANRDHGSLTVAIQKKRLPEFKEKLKQVRRELSEYFQSNENFDEVYQLNVSFFPITKIQEGDLK
jgi:plasmid maintenance system antidote protein VapI